MMRDWKTSDPIEKAYYCWKDLMLEDEFGITETDWDRVIEQTVAHVRSVSDQDITSRLSRILDLLLPPLPTLWREKDAELPFRWLPCQSLQGATVADHSLTASAIAYCLGYDDEKIRADSETLDKLRLSAMTATWEADGLGDVHETLWAEHSPIQPKADGDALERMVFFAKTVASDRISINTVDQFSTHPLKDEKQQIGLVMGGATKIKSYFLESARLPEIRGASALLDRINLEDIPALFGRNIPHDPERAKRFHKDFGERTGHYLFAPECIIYAAGGSTLAFTPTTVVHQIADEIERIYTKETLVANSVAVGRAFDLLELQYGLNPTGFSRDGNIPESKCFGELTTKLAQAQLHRREGNPTPNRTTQRNFPTHVEVNPYQQRCQSCDRRPRIISEPTLRELCEACTRKYVVGRITKKESETASAQGGINRYLEKLSDWEPATFEKQRGWGLKDWSTLFKEYLQATGKVDCYVDKSGDLKQVAGPQNLEDIASATKPSGFITFIYADGNNMGGYLEKVKTPAEYRQFSERVFIAIQKAAFDALAEHLSPTESGIHPFEIVSIGGDDLLLIVPGSKAFEVVSAMGENFDRAFKSYSRFAGEDRLQKSQRYASRQWVADQHGMQPTFSLSLGFVIANEHTPIGFLEHLADSLLKSAKTRAKKLKKEDGYLGGTVDFLVLKSFSTLTSDLGDFRKRFYKTDTEHENSLTMRPFTLNELSGFIETIRAFRSGRFPRSQLYGLRESLRLGRQTSTLDYLYFRSRLRAEDGQLLQQELESNWESAPDIVGGQGPWYALPKSHENDATRYETLLFDIIEAYEFIRKEGDGSDESSD